MLTNGFDAVGRVNGVAGGSLNYASNVAYDPTGPVSGLTLGNGLVEQWTFGTSQKQPTRLVAAATQPDLSYKVNDTWVSPETASGLLTPTVKNPTIQP